MKIVNKKNSRKIIEDLIKAGDIPEAARQIDLRGFRFKDFPEVYEDHKEQYSEAHTLCDDPTHNH